MSRPISLFWSTICLLTLPLSRFLRFSVAASRGRRSAGCPPRLCFRGSLSGRFGALCLTSRCYRVALRQLWCQAICFFATDVLRCIRVSLPLRFALAALDASVRRCPAGTPPVCRMVKISLMPRSSSKSRLRIILCGFIEVPPGAPIRPRAWRARAAGSVPGGAGTIFGAPVWLRAGWPAHVFRQVRQLSVCLL